MALMTDYVSVPTSDAFATLEGRVAELEGLTGNIVYPGTGDDDAAVNKAFSAVLDSIVDGVARLPLLFMAGTYTLTQPLVPGNAFSEQIDGLSIFGYDGPGKTVIHWQGSQPWIDTTGMRFRDFLMQDLGFVGASTNSTLIRMISGSAPYNNKWLFENIDVSGSWNYFIGIGKPSNEAMNLNSELVFRRVSTAPSTIFADAFMHCGLSNDNSENQSLDHSYYDCNFSLTSGIIWNYVRGGSVHVFGGSCSAANANGNITWINLPGANANNPKVNQYQFTGVFFEPKSANHRVIYCERADGTIAFRDCEDLSSLQQSTPTTVNTYRLHSYKLPAPWGSGTGASGPCVLYENHIMVGRILVDCGGITQKRGGFRVTGSKVYNGLNAEMAYPASASNAASVNAVIDPRNGMAQYALQYNYNIPNAVNWP
jgi:hypothetical protein